MNDVVYVPSMNAFSLIRSDCIGPVWSTPSMTISHSAACILRMASARVAA